LITTTAGAGIGKLSILKTAQPHDANPRALRRPGPGSGEMLRLGRL
jgi:hypothetical protein